MSAFETVSIVQEQGGIFLAGVPFAPGTEVHVSISAKVPSEEDVTRFGSDALTAARERTRELFGTITGFRNTPRIPRCCTLSLRRAMRTYLLKGSKQEIAEALARINDDVREAIVFVEEPALAASGAASSEAEDIFAEMRPFMVDVPYADDSRETIYTRMEGESL